ncbi:phospholipase A and acyltransferase 3-like [Sorex araneus]|uniref:phospholipase A and acyltransferase 3-like n=1 Tax=Sorex araneus TaxID=42254 RepID=UPI002433938F|nr:phospholipase A and acyltransferase 3-like [Sorex araneus]
MGASSSSNREDPEPQPGDLIEIFCGVYEHWAVYVGDGYVVHVTDVGGGGRSGVNLSGSVLGLSSRAMVKKDLLSEVTAGRRYKVNNKYDEEMGARPAAEIVQRALTSVGQEWNYNLMLENREHFATYMRYRIARSHQVCPHPQHCPH